MKRTFLSFVLLAALLIGQLIQPAFAADTASDFVLRPESGSAQVGQEFEITAAFTEQISSNTAVLNFSFDRAYVSFVDFIAADGVNMISKEETEAGLELVLMITSYSTETYGKLVLHADAQTQESPISVQADIRYVIRKENEEKEIKTTNAAVLIPIIEAHTPRPPEVEGDTNYDGVVNMIDLSNMIDWMGTTDSIPNWEDLYQFFDFNDNGEIDAYDVAYVSSLISIEDDAEPNADALAKAITAALQIDKDAYTDESVEKLETALAAAKQVLAELETKTQDEVDAAAQAVNDAIAALETKPGALDKSELINAIAAAEALNPDDYTEESAAALAEAIEAANATLGTAKTPEDVAAAVSALKDAIGKLENKPVEPPAEEVDKTALEDAIKAAEKVSKDKYTAESVAALEKALEAAKAVQADSEATQDAVDDAAKALGDAVEALKENPFRFDDVQDETRFYFEPVYWAFNAVPQITNGITQTLFGPDNDCTRGQVVTFLWRAAGCPEPKSSENPFQDLKAGAFYEKAVAWAVEEGITKGTSDTTFAPDATCSRGQIVTFLWRFRGEEEPKSTTTPFTDLKPGAFYEKAVTWAVEEGITKGTSNTTFEPDATCTRGQIVTFLYRAMKEK